MTGRKTGWWWKLSGKEEEAEHCVRLSDGFSNKKSQELSFKRNTRSSICPRFHSQG